MSDPPDRIARPCLALPYTILDSPGVVRMVAGEDHRYTLEAPGLDAWLPGLLAACDGRRPLDDLLGGLDESTRRQARELIGRLYGERVLVDGPIDRAHEPSACALVVEGGGALVDRLVDVEAAGPGRLLVFCQDRLDHASALDFNARRLRDGAPWIWATTGPMGRGYVGPVFRPGIGPCWACLLGQFRRLSPAPEFYDALIAHARGGGAIAPAEFPPEGVEVLAQLVLWKRDQLARDEPAPALYRLHVLEVDAMEINAHRVPIDPECPACGGPAVVGDALV